jgi:hypothetical protein
MVDVKCGSGTAWVVPDIRSVRAGSERARRHFNFMVLYFTPINAHLSRQQVTMKYFRALLEQIIGIDHLSHDK